MKKAGRLVAALCILALALGGCAMNMSNSFSQTPTTLVESNNGYSFKVPEDWQQLAAEDEYLQYRYATADNQLAMSVFMELGGVEYYSLAEVGAKLADSVAEQLFAATPERTESSGKTGSSYSCVLRGLDADGAEIVSRIELLTPCAAARYYLLFTAGADAYQANEKIISGVASSFTVSLSDEEIYQLLAGRREAEAAAQADEAGQGEGEAEPGADGQGEGGAEPDGQNVDQQPDGQ